MIWQIETQDEQLLLECEVWKENANLSSNIYFNSKLAKQLSGKDKQIKTLMNNLNNIEQHIQTLPVDDERYILYIRDYLNQQIGQMYQLGLTIRED
jgi:hypothetical protein